MSEPNESPAEVLAVEEGDAPEVPAIPGKLVRARAPRGYRVEVTVPDGVDPWTYIPKEYVGHPIAPNFYCRGWNSKRKKYCRSKAGHGTTHLGEARCKNHEGRPITTGSPIRYHDLHHKTLGDLVRKHQDDPDPLNLFGELALARGLLEMFVEEYSAFAQELRDWHDSYKLTKMPISQEDADGYIRVVTEYAIMLKESGQYTDLQIADCTRAERFVKSFLRPVHEGRPRKIVEITEARHIVDSIVKVVSTLNERSTVTEAEVSRMISSMTRVVDVIVPDPEVRKKIREGWVKIFAR